jgi:hypothetical protein
MVRGPWFYLLVELGFGFVASTGNSFFECRHVRGQVFNIADIGLLSTMPFGMAIVAQYLLAQDADRTGERRPQAARRRLSRSG